MNIDEVRKQWMDIMAVEAQWPHNLVIHGKFLGRRVAIGNIFGMDVIADPKCPEGSFYIETVKKVEEPQNAND